MADSQAVREQATGADSGRRRMADRFGFWLGMANLVVLVPFAILPFTLLRTDHMMFHLVYIPCLIIGLWVIWQLKGLAQHRPLRVLAWILLAAQTIALLGHAGELFAVIQYGGFDAPYEVFEEPEHEMSARFALPAIMLTILTMIVIDLTAGIQGILHRAHRVQRHGLALEK